jgi:hypothetical protein
MWPRWDGPWHSLPAPVLPTAQPSFAKDLLLQLFTQSTRTEFCSSVLEHLHQQDKHKKTPTTAAISVCVSSHSILEPTPIHQNYLRRHDWPTVN